MTIKSKLEWVCEFLLFQPSRSVTVKAAECGTRQTSPYLALTPHIRLFAHANITPKRWFQLVADQAFNFARTNELKREKNAWASHEILILYFFLLLIPQSRSLTHEKKIHRAFEIQRLTKPAKWNSIQFNRKGGKKWLTRRNEVNWMLTRRWRFTDLSTNSLVWSTKKKLNYSLAVNSQLGNGCEVQFMIHSTTSKTFSLLQWFKCSLRVVMRVLMLGQVVNWHLIILLQVQTSSNKQINVLSSINFFV